MDFQGVKDPLQQFSLSPSAQDALLTCTKMWEASGVPQSLAGIDLSTYFDYRSRRIKRLLLDGGCGPILESDRDLLLIAQKILSPRTTRDELYRELTAPEKHDASLQGSKVDRAIDLCASLLTMVEVEIKDSPTGLSGSTPLRWERGSLEDALAAHFTPQTTLQVDNSKLGRLFTARNLSRIGGIRIQWTTNLGDHLRLIDDDETVLIFNCVGFLQLQESLKHNPFPRHFIKETLNTLSLLFPSTDSDTRRWLEMQTKADPQLSRCGSLRTGQRRLENFSFWRDRLVILKQAFDESQPKALSQWWYDRRNGVQWYTFWVAILVFGTTIFFGLIQSIEGALQVYLAYEARGQD